MQFCSTYGSCKKEKHFEYEIQKHLHKMVSKLLFPAGKWIF